MQVFDIRVTGFAFVIAHHAYPSDVLSNHCGSESDNFIRVSLLDALSHVFRNSANINRTGKLQHVLQPFLWLRRTVQKPS